VSAYQQSGLAQQGSKAYSDQFDLVYRREAEAPNAIWQADHTLLDILVQQENGEPGRPWLSIVIDDYSRSIAATCWTHQSFHVAKRYAKVVCKGQDSSDLSSEYSKAARWLRNIGF
jgi:transposase InsO family protein